MNAPRFIAVFKAPPWRIARNVEKGVIDHVVNIAYDETGQRWGFVERVTAGETRAAAYQRISRGWVKLPTKILDETWEETP